MAEVKKMNVEIIKQTTANGEVARVGDVIEVAENDGRFLVGAKHAILAGRNSRLQKSEKPQPPRAARGGKAPDGNGEGGKKDPE